MKAKYTKQNEIDFYYLLLINYSQYQMCFLRDEDFNNNPTNFTNILDKFQREVSTEKFDFYISDLGKDCVSEGQAFIFSVSSDKNDLYKHKVKITICEDE